MADEFDRFLAEALAPEPREADRACVARVHGGIALDRQLRAERKALLRRFGVEMLGVAAIAAALLWLAREAPVAELAAGSPAAALAGLLLAFSLLLLLFSRTDSPRRAALEI